MKPLNRPMFRYGGPIKEGVMSGIREPKKNGGLSKQFGTGLVGDERYPKTSGREHHLAVVPFLGLNALRTAAGRALPAVANFFRSKAGQVTGGTGATKYASQRMAPLTTKEKIAGFFQTAPAGKFVAQDPAVKFLTGTGGFATKAIKPTAKFMFGSPTGLALSGYSGKQIYDALKSDPKVDSDGDGVSDVNAAKAAIGMPENLTLGGGQKIKVEGDGGDGPSASDLAKSRMAANRKKYYEIMGIDKMGREATGDALINASRAINQLNTQGIGLKEGLKSGQLQNLVIEGISSAMDKPAKTRQAVDAAILKAEINKEMNKDQNELANMLRVKQIEGLDRAAKEDSLEGDLKAYFTKNGAFPSGQQLSQIARIRGVDIAGVESDITAVNEHISKGGDEVSYMQEIIAQGGDVPPGIHVIGSRLIAVGEDKKVTAVL